MDTKQEIYTDLIIASARLFRRLTKNVLSGETAIDLRVLSTVEINPGLTVGTLAEILVCSQPAATKMVNKLEEAGYLKKKKSPTDGRAYHIHMTEEGEKRLRDERAAVAEFIQPALDNLSTEDIQSLERAVDILNYFLDQHITAEKQ